MRTSFRPATAVAVLLLTFAAACGDSTATTGPAAPKSERLHASATAPAPGTCITLAELTNLVNQVFGAGSPNANSALGKLDNIRHQIELGNFATAKEHAFSLVQFILGKAKPGGLPGTPAQLTSLVNGILCYAGLGLVITDPSNTFLVYPSDAPQTLISSDGLAGTALPANPVSEPTFVSFYSIPNTFPPGGGPLDTRLDQYAGYIGLSKASENSTPFTQPVTVGVCAAPGIPAAVRARLRLGHDAIAGFEITPPADASFLQCPVEIAQASPGLLRSLANFFLPRELHAKQAFLSGGVGGTAGEYSEFAPVDPVVSFGGGVGGTAGEYIRRGPVSASLISGNGCTPIEAPVGTPVDAACLPFVTITTTLGTVLTGVPVTWTITQGGGTIAPRSNGICGAFASSANTTSAITGMTGICWTLGAAGANTVVATPSIGGDADAGVVFNPATVTFDAIANPAVGIVFGQQLPGSITAGTPFSVSANIVDKYGNLVLGATNAITLTLNQYALANGTTSANANAVQGTATFAALQINKAATGYQLTASSGVIVAPNVPALSNVFDIVAGPAFALAITAGNNQTAAAGTALPVNPTVAVSDQFGNLVSGTSITWTPGGSSGGSVSPAMSTTGTSGTTSTSWTVGDGANELTAAVTTAPLISALFNATGTTTLVSFNDCAVGGSGDPINDPGKTYAFYIPNPGNNKTIREIQLYLSSTGKANTPTTYSVRLTTQLGTFDPAVSTPVPTTTTVFLRGNNSENKLTTFKLSTPIAGSGNGPNIMVRLAVLTNPDGATLNFNTGPCSPGSNCKVPPSCKATEVNSVTPYPAGTTYRKSVGITVKGN